MPIVFVHAQGPSQTVYGTPYDGDKAEYTRHKIRFKSSRTFLHTLLPTKSFSFVSPGTVAEASFENTTLNKMDWLREGGYNFLDLWIHGIQYTKKNGSKLFGSFLVVFFESLSDPITTGREELGMPKMFYDIEIFRRNKSSRIKTGWRGTTFATLEWEDVKEVEIQPEANDDAVDMDSIPEFARSPQDDVLFIYRYVPAVGKRGVADAEYPVFVNKHKTATPQIVRRRWRASKAKVSLEGLQLGRSSYSSSHRGWSGRSTHPRNDQGGN